MRTISRRLRAIFKPAMFQGWGKQRSYFEGWYYKLVSADERHLYAIIPGIAMDTEGKQQAFIQVLDGRQLSADYHRFDIESFSSNTKAFDIRIAGSRFTTASLDLDMPGLSGSLTFHQQLPWPWKWYSPGIMGPYTFVPLMECYHGILSMDHIIEGELQIQGRRIDFSRGRGYMEKDWGRSFPSAYVWMQCNHFSSSGISIKVSVARIPWLGSSFTGFIAGIQFEGQLYRFTTYNGSRLERSQAEKDRVLIEMVNSTHRLSIEAFRKDATELASPILGLMDGRISESMESEVRIRLSQVSDGKVIFEDLGRNVALEVAGEIERIRV
jgi:tocopherol cyclase